MDDFERVCKKIDDVSDLIDKKKKEAEQRLQRVAFWAFLAGTIVGRILSH